MTTQEYKIQQSLLTLAYHDFEKGLKVHSFFKVQNPILSEDLVQDTFIKAWKYLVKGGKIETMKAFLYHVLNNLIIDEYRKRKVSSLDVLIENGYEPATTESDRIFNIIDGENAMFLINRLPKKYQAVMHMKYIKNLSLDEMSRQTGESKNTMAVQIHRGLQKLKLLYDRK